MTALSMPMLPEIPDSKTIRDGSVGAGIVLGLIAIIKGWLGIKNHRAKADGEKAAAESEERKAAAHTDVVTVDTNYVLVMHALEENRQQRQDMNEMLAHISATEAQVKILLGFKNHLMTVVIFVVGQYQMVRGRLEQRMTAEGMSREQITTELGQPLDVKELMKPPVP